MCRHIELDDTQLYGWLPTNLALMTALSRLDVSDSQYVGTLPALPPSLA